MFILYVIILTLGFMTSYTDIRLRIIKNNHLILAIFFGGIVFLNLIATNQILFSMNLVWNLLIGLAIGLILYFSDTWGAGDAKLFIVYCLLMPTEKYSKILFFPSIAIFANIFLVSTVGILVLSFKDIINDRIRIVKRIFSLDMLNVLGRSFLIIFSLKWIIESIVNFFIPQAIFYISMLILFILYIVIKRALEKYKGNRVVPAILALGFVMRFFVFTLEFNIESFFYYLKNTSFYAFLFYLISSVFDLKESEDKEIKRIPFAPFMFFGTILTNTDFINWIINILKAIRK